MEGLIKSVANLIVYVHPSQTKNVDKAILCELSSLLFKYSQAFDGVVLFYSVEPQDKCARILSGVHPYLVSDYKQHADLLAEAEHAFSEVFVHLLNAYFTEPIIEGKVVKLTRESIHCIVLGFSSAIVTDENIRNELKYKSEIIHISGSLIPANTGSVHWLDKYYVDTGTDSNKETRRQTKEDVEMQEQVTVGGETMPLVNNSHKIKKSKKRRRAEDQ